MSAHFQRPDKPHSISDISDHDLDFLVDRLMAETAAEPAEIPVAALAQLPAEAGADDRGSTGFGGSENRWRNWGLAAAAALAVLAGIGLWAPAPMSSDSAQGSSTATGNPSRSNHTAAPPRSRPDAGATDIDGRSTPHGAGGNQGADDGGSPQDPHLVGLTTLQQLAATHALRGAHDFSGLDISTSECLSNVGLAHAPVLGAAPVPRSDPQQAADQPTPTGSAGDQSVERDQLLVLGNPMRIVVIEHSCASAEESVLTSISLEEMNAAY